jgi:hypothetical protein
MRMAADRSSANDPGSFERARRNPAAPSTAPLGVQGAAVQLRPSADLLALQRIIADRPAGAAKSGPVGAIQAKQVQAREGLDADSASVHEAAQQGTRGAGGPLPYLEQIQKSFGHHDVTGVTAHSDAQAREGAQRMGAEAFTLANHVAFARAPSLHTAAHEAAHVVQQRMGVQLEDGVGEVGDRYEAHADAVADRVVQGQSTQALLDEHAGGVLGGPNRGQEAVLQRKAAAHPPPAGGGPLVTSAWAETVRANFALWDANRDGFLSMLEIDQAMQDGTVTGAAAAALVELKQCYSTLEDQSDDEVGFETSGVTRRDLDAYERSLPSPAKELKNIETNFAGSKTKISNRTRELFIPAESPNPVFLTQGRLGDCYFLAAVAAQAYHDPRVIVRMIKENRGGTYTVTFPGRKPVTVTAPTDAEVARGASAGANGSWVTVLEKAYAQSEASAGAQDPQKAIDSPHTTGKGVEDVTGSSDTDVLALTPLTTTRAKMKSHLPGKVVTALIGSDNKYKLPSGHIYSVMSYTEATDKVWLRNPWGHTGPKDDHGRDLPGTFEGGFELTLREFDSIFRTVTYQR